MTSNLFSFLYSRLAFVTFCFVFPFMNIVFAQCVNGDTELNSFQGWSGGHSERTLQGIELSNMVSQIHPSYHQIMNVGFDPVVGGTLLSTVGEGNHSFRIGNTLADSHADRLSYTFLVTNANANFSFMFAMVLQDGEHSGNENPFFQYTISIGNNPNDFSNIIIYNQFIANLDDPFFKKKGNIVWKNWSRECVDLSSYIGQTVTISFYAADCAHGGHFGYAYVDGLCTDFTPIPSFKLPEKVCVSDVILMDASQSTNEDSYFLSVQESNQWWNSIGEEYTQWFVAQNAGVIDLKSFLNSKGSTFKCNTYYRVKLAVGNKCVPWVSETKLLFISCPQMNQIEDVVRCCKEISSVVQLGPATNDPSNSVSWSTNGGVTFTPFQPYLNEYASFYNNSNGYVDVYVESGSCSLSQRVFFLTIPDFEVLIEENKINCCETKLTAKVQFIGKCSDRSTEEYRQLILDKLNFTWSTGETTNSIIVSGSSKEYTIKVTGPNGCYEKEVVYQYLQSPMYINSTEYPFALSAPNALISGSTGNNGKLIIIGSYNDNQGPYFPPLNTHQGIYKTQQMQIVVWNRWGELIFSRIFDDCGTLYQGDVFWDGRDNNGNFVQPGAYTFKIYTKICGSNTFRPYCNSNHRLNTSACLKYCFKPFWPFGRYCCDKITGGDCGYVINVIK